MKVERLSSICGSISTYTCEVRGLPRAYKRNEVPTQKAWMAVVPFKSVAIILKFN